MSNIKYQTFNVGQAGAGRIDLTNGNTEFAINAIPNAESLYVGTSLIFSLQNTPITTIYGRGFKLNAGEGTSSIVTKDSEGHIVEIKGRDNKNIVFVYSPSTGSAKKLQIIKDLKNNTQVSFGYTGDLLTEVTNKDNEKTIIKYANNDIVEIKAPSKIGIEIVRNGSNITLKEISELSGTRQNKNSIEIIRTASGNIINATVKNIKTGTTLQKHLNTINSANHEYFYQEKLNVDGVCKQSVTEFKGAVDSNQRKCTFTCVQNKSSDLIIEDFNGTNLSDLLIQSILKNLMGAQWVLTRLNTSGKPLIQYYSDKEGKNSNGQYITQTLRNDFEYSGDKLTKETSTLTTGTGSDKRIFVKDYIYNEKNKLVTIKDDFLKLITDIEYGQFGEEKSVRTYHQSNNVQAIIVEAQTQNSNPSNPNYVTSTSENGFLKILESGTSRVDYDYELWGRRKSVKLNNASTPFVQYSYDDVLDEVTTTYVNDTYKTQLDKFGKVIAIKRNGAELVRNIYDSKDRLTNIIDQNDGLQETQIFYNASNNEVSQIKQGEVTVTPFASIDGQYTKDTYAIDGRPAQNYIYQLDNPYNVRKKTTTLPTGEQEEAYIDQFGRLTSVNSPVGTSTLKYKTNSKPYWKALFEGERSLGGGEFFNDEMINGVKYLIYRWRLSDFFEENGWGSLRLTFTPAIRPDSVTFYIYEQSSYKNISYFENYEAKADPYFFYLKFPESHYSTVMNSNFLKMESYESQHAITNFVSELTDRNDKTEYSYDSKENITQIKQNNTVIASYTYDAYNRLKSNNGVQITYDNNGNILTKGGSTYTYSGDRLMSYNGESFVYDELGNPKIYRNKSLAWDFRNLKSFGDVSFNYDSSGLRKSKIQNKDSTKYYWAGDQLLAEKRVITHKSFDRRITKDSQNHSLSITEFVLGCNMYKDIVNEMHIDYIYGINGVIGFTLQKDNGAVQKYWYLKNAQGDVTHVYDSSDVLKAQYQYDAWGVCTIISDVYGIGTLNPIRYRSYYWDNEINLYYLKSRYYDPEVGRFISPDSVSILDATMYLPNGLNLYAYCANNPIHYIDITGSLPAINYMGDGLDFIGALFGAIDAAIVLSIPRSMLFARYGMDRFGALMHGTTGFGKASSMLGWAALLLTVGTDIYNNINAGASFSHTTASAIVTGVTTWAIMKASAMAGAGIGLIGGPVGAAIGFGVGLGVGVLATLFVHNEFLGTGKSLVGWATYGLEQGFDWIGNAFDDAVDWVDNAFNDFVNFIRRPFGFRLW